MEAQLKAQVIAYLQVHQVMVLATHGELGVWATAVFYVSDGFDCYFLSAAHTRHAQNLAVGWASAAIQEDYKDWQAIQGIQMEGSVQLLTGDDREKALRLYWQKFPFLAQPVPEIATALEKVGWYRLRPLRLYFIDNTKGLGHREELFNHLSANDS
ncbi:MAG: hypothetical protein Kow0080_13830 [Candidatus Promineifilaceae bacterium]